MYDNFILKAFVSQYTDDNPSFYDSLLQIMESLGLVSEVLGQELRNEVEYTLTLSQLFRTNKGVTFVMAALCRLLTKDLLKEYISPLIEEVNNLPEVIEMDKSKVSEEKVKENIEITKEFIDKFFAISRELCSKLPKELTSLFTVVRQAVAAKYGDKEALKIVGGFVFLRLLNPVLLTPQKFSTELVKPTPTAIRSFVAITKITQVCVNQPTNPFKEDYMLPLTDYAKSKYSVVNEILDIASINNEIITKKNQQPITPSVLVSNGLCIIESIKKFSEVNPTKFQTFCDLILYKGRKQALEQLLYLVDKTGELSNKCNVQIPEFPGVVLESSDQHLIDSMVENFDNIISTYQVWVTKLTEQIIEKPRDGAARRDAFYNSTSTSPVPVCLNV